MERSITTELSCNAVEMLNYRLSSEGIHAGEGTCQMELSRLKAGGFLYDLCFKVRYTAETITLTEHMGDYEMGTVATPLSISGLEIGTYDNDTPEVDAAEVEKIINSKL